MIIDSPNVPAPTNHCESEYRPFPNIHRRNLTQAHVEIPAMIRLMRLPQGQRVLEVGCGRGIALQPFAQLLRPARLVGLDVDAALLTEAEAGILAQRIPAKVAQNDVRAMPFPSRSFDLIIDFGTCYHISSPDMALREIARVLAPGGKFVYETRASQLLSHPIRSFNRTLPWRAVPELMPHRHALLWASRMKRAE